MRKFIQSRSAWEIMMVSLLAFFATVGAVMATTTIGTNIVTNGAIYATSTLLVDGATTFNGNVTFGNASTDVNLFTGKLQASTTALFTGAVTLYNSTTTLADGTTLSSGSMSGTTLRSLYIVPKASVATAGVNYHKLIEIDGTFGDVSKRTYGLVAGFSRDDATTGDLDGVDTGFDLRVTNDPINVAGAELQGAYIKAKNDGNGDGTGGFLDSMKGLYVEAYNEEFATATTLIGVDIGVLADGTETTATALNIRTLTGGDRSVNTFKDISLQYGETIDNITDGVISLMGIASTTSIRLTNLETITNGTNGTITLSTDGGATVSFTPTAAGATITPGGTGTITIGGAFVVNGYATTTNVGVVVPVSTTTAPTCNSSVAGGIIWNSTKAKTCVCSGSNWTEATSTNAAACF